MSTVAPRARDTGSNGENPSTPQSTTMASIPNPSSPRGLVPDAHLYPYPLRPLPCSRPRQSAIVRSELFASPNPLEHLLYVHKAHWSWVATAVSISYCIIPRTSLPLTPASSSDIPGKDQAPPSVREMSWTLPSPAMAPANKNGRTARPQPIRPATEKPNFSLPPPPTRSRKIIQMKPAQQQKTTDPSPTQQLSLKVSGRRSASGQSSVAGRKQLSSTSAAGKKMARKTAHSVIERRRRSKMNEEFAVLRDLIPACKNQDMHKLAILSVRSHLLVFGTE